MTILALDFVSPWLLVGLLAAAIPVVLHLLSSVRAPEVYFPTLRFLRTSMEKTARRRRLEHWLLLLVRSGLLAMLALAVAEPVVRSAAGFWSDRRFAAVLIVDNSYSMGLSADGRTRFDHARRQAGELLGGSSKPTLAALLLTNESDRPDALRADLDELRDALARAHLASGKADLPACIRQAAELLAKQSAPQKAIYLFTDLQQVSLEGLAAMPQLQADNVQLMLVDCSLKLPANVGIADLRLGGALVAGASVELTATLVNSSPTDKTVETFLQVDGRSMGESVRKTLRKAGADGDRASIRFHHRFTQPGPHTGAVAIAEEDDLPADNVRHFAVTVAPKVRAVLVRGGPAQPGPADDAGVLQVALDPMEGAAPAWPIRLSTLAAAQFSPADLADADVVLLPEPSALSKAQAADVVRFVRDGGWGVLFMPGATNPANINENFGPLLPGTVGPAVGQVGLTEQAVRAAKNLRHPYLAGLYETAEDYPEVLVQRYFKIALGQGFEPLLSGPAGEPIAAARPAGQGRSIVFATTAGAEWNNLPGTTLLLPMLARICLEAGSRRGGDQSVSAGTPASIAPAMALPPKAAVNVKTPDGTVDLLPLPDGPASGPAAARARTVSYPKTHTPGLYEWQVAGAGPEVEGARGAFASNIDGAEADLAGATPGAFAAAVAPAPVFAGKTLAEVHQAAADAGTGDNFWDRLAAIAIVLLVVEAVAANPFRKSADMVPAHLNPRLR